MVEVNDPSLLINDGHGGDVPEEGREGGEWVGGRRRGGRGLCAWGKGAAQWSESEKVKGRGREGGKEERKEGRKEERQKEGKEER
jgi:hypothetical protein